MAYRLGGRHRILVSKSSSVHVLGLKYLNRVDYGCANYQTDVQFRVPIGKDLGH